MQSWQIKALKLEGAALTHLDGFVRDHALWSLIGVIYLLLALLAWVLSGGLRRKGNPTAYHVRPTIVIYQTQSPPQVPEESNPFPPLRHPPEYAPDDYGD
jgi:hypothetical protein